MRYTYYVTYIGISLGKKEDKLGIRASSTGMILYICTIIYIYAWISYYCYTTKYMTYIHITHPLLTYSTAQCLYTKYTLYNLSTCIIYVYMYISSYITYTYTIYILI